MAGLVARQFVEMTRIRLEVSNCIFNCSLCIDVYYIYCFLNGHIDYFVQGLLSAFPKLLGTDSKQHTFVETESVRCVR